MLLAFVSGCGTELAITSTPDGAQVSELSKGDIGSTDASDQASTVYKSLLAKRRDFIFKKPGYEEQRIVRNVWRRDQIVHAMLKAKDTNIVVDALPTDAQIKISCNGKEVCWAGDLPPVEVRGDIVDIDDPSLWTEGERQTFTVDVSAPGYVSRQLDVFVDRGTSHRIAVVLPQKTALVSVTSEPAGATVYDRSLGYLGVTPMTAAVAYDDLQRIGDVADLDATQVGRLYLRLEKDGYATHEQALGLSMDGETNTMNVSLKTEQSGEQK